ncbi:hypothetical protein [Galactobacillus timonensis]|uniref:hypothetical protein n=1 Tax=Galactobacillus timonensis TaxID=2041840 RepID=UPI001082D106|nr:hypothetical protein [Galactobacillus timonensis]
MSSDIAIYFKADSRSSSAASGLITRITLSSASSLPRKLILPYHNIFVGTLRADESSDALPCRLQQSNDYSCRKDHEEAGHCHPCQDQALRPFLREHESDIPADDKEHQRSDDIARKIGQKLKQKLDSPDNQEQRNCEDYENNTNRQHGFSASFSISDFSKTEQSGDRKDADAKLPHRRERLENSLFPPPGSCQTVPADPKRIGIGLHAGTSHLFKLHHHITLFLPCLQGGWSFRLPFCFSYIVLLRQLKHSVLAFIATDMIGALIFQADCGCGFLMHCSYTFASCS